MFVTILGRAAGVEAEDYAGETEFTDVASGTWYSAYVNWASENGLVLGRGNGAFDPQGTITRQEIVTILARFAAFMGEDVSVEDAAVLDAYADADEIAAYAVDAFAWAVENGIINGTGDGLEPKGLATRAQIAQIIYKFDAAF